MFKRWVKIAVDEANKSTFSFKVGAVVFNKSQFISSGHNYSERSIKHHLSKFRKTEFSLHAEVSAILKAKTDLKGASILVVRINRKNKFRLSKPCIHCYNYLKYVGIKKCYYSIDHYPYIEEMKIK